VTGVQTCALPISDAKAPRDLDAFRQAAEAVFRKHSDPLTLDAVKAYFGEVYWMKGADALDAAKVGGYSGILAAIRERAPSLDFSFASIAEAFRMIEDVMEPVVVPWRANDGDRDAEALLARIAASERPRRDDMRRLQQYIVGIPRKARAEWLVAGVLRPVHPGLGDAVLKLASLALYDSDTGVRLDGTMNDTIV
jgi:CRISPR-associated endonuclease/helicase Cas3